MVMERFPSFDVSIRSRPEAGVNADDVAVVFSAASHAYRTFRIFQYVELHGASLKNLKDERAFLEWLLNPHSPATQGYTDVAVIAEWVGGLEIASIAQGSVESVLAAFGRGAGEGVSAAAQGVALAFRTIITAPADFRSRWAQGRLLNADAREREAEAAAAEAKVDSLVWSGQVLRGERPFTPDQFHYALEIQVKAGMITRRAADLMVDLLTRDVEAVASLAGRQLVEIGPPA